MKKRTFYVINLDRNRILILSLLMVGFLLVTFATGLRLGKDKQQSRSLAVLDRPIPDLLPKPERKTEQTKPIDNQSDIGHSKYSITDAQTKTREPSSLDRMVTRQRQEEQRKRALREKEQTRTGSAPRRNTIVRKNKNPGRRVKSKTTRASTRKKTRQVAHKKARAAHKTQDKRTALLNGKKKTSSFKNTGYSRGVPGSNRERKQTAVNHRIYSLQVGSYSSKSGAHNVAARLKKQGFYPYVSRAGKHYKVSVGRNSNRRQLLGLNKRLQSKKYRPIIVSYKKRKR